MCNAICVTQNMKPKKCTEPNKTQKTLQAESLFLPNCYYYDLLLLASLISF